MKHILLVEDDPILAKVISSHLKSESYLVTCLDSGKKALDSIDRDNFSLLILDWMLPDLTGLEVCENVRKIGIKTPILMLTGRVAVNDKANALDAGADDYLVKPFESIELKARVRALIRRGSDSFNRKVCGDFEIEPDNKLVFYKGKEIPFLPKEYEIMELFLLHPNKYFSSEAVFHRVWGSSSDTTLNTVRSHIREIRKKLKAFGLDANLENMRGRGYRIKSNS